MAQLVPVGRERHAGRRWRRPENYGFAAGDALVPVVGAELSRSALAMPVAFVEQSGGYQLMAVLSLKPGRNMFVGADGRWLGGYAPAFLQSHPFRLLQREGTEESVLCVDEDGELIVDGASPGEAFFDVDGHASQALKPILDFLTRAERSRKATQIAISALAEAGIIRPWPIQLKTAEAEQTVSGLHRIDEAALNALADDAFLKLRKASALPVAYAQMLSIGQLGVFEQLAKFHAHSARTAVAMQSKSIEDLLQVPPDDTIHFDFE
jgi:hypothetical protein